ncbi:YciI family protein [Aliiroseovarius sp.]|uniref:YciI family protein n=1 Tax=Aliiroseovarius sp. TaxID=1872442 RepID=UPI002623CA39|nr:YciI family protein [Aliiroseovarius sp.]
MLIAVICTDKPGALETRLSNRDAHVAYLKETGAVQAGPFLNDKGEMYGSLVILDMESVDDARAWAADDPYARAGLFSDVRIEEWKRVIG